MRDEPLLLVCELLPDDSRYVAPPRGFLAVVGHPRVWTVGLTYIETLIVGAVQNVGPRRVPCSKTLYALQF
jgi:hypothetical protein